LCLAVVRLPVMACWVFLAHLAMLLGNCRPAARRSISDEPLVVGLVVPSAPCPAFERIVVVPVLSLSSETASNLARLIERLAHSSLIIIIDDGSCEERSKQLVAACRSSELHRVHLAKLSRNCGPAHARNIGLRIASGYAESKRGVPVLFTDSDCLPPLGWDVALASQVVTHGALVGGFTRASADPGCWTIAAFHDCLGTLNPRVWNSEIGREFPRCAYLPTCNLGMPLHIALRVRFNPAFPNASYEDVDFCVRAHTLGYPCVLARDIVMEHVFDATPAGLWHQFNKYGQSELLAATLNPDVPRAIELSSMVTTPAHVRVA
jgi:glycosyltransferase involved in cell wall biosynthesis